jgi:hypothetical protein
MLSDIIEKVDKGLAHKRTELVKIIQYNGGYGWEDYSYYDRHDKTIRDDIKEARKTGGDWRIISRRVPV